MDTDSGGSCSPNSEGGDMKETYNKGCGMDLVACPVETASVESSKDDTMMMIRDTDTPEQFDQVTGHHQDLDTPETGLFDQLTGHGQGFTASFVNQFDRDLSLSSDCDGAESEQTWEEEEEGDEGELAEILSSERDNEEEASGNISSEGEGEEEGEGVSSDVEASSDSEFEQDKVSHDMAGDDQCVSMDTDVTRTPSAKDEIMAMEDDRMEERWERRETHVGHLVGAGDGCSVEDEDTASDYVNLDLSLVQSKDPELNIAASKHRVVLRNKGSLAKRRKPSRLSVRASYYATQTYIDSTDAPQGHDLFDHDDTPLDGAAPCAVRPSEAHLNGDSNGLAVNDTAPSYVMLPEGKNNQVTLRSNPPLPACHPHSTLVATNSSKPWLCKALRPPSEEVEKLRRRSQLGKPSWMKEVLAKRKRRSEIFMLHDESREDSVLSQKEAGVSSSHWLTDTSTFCPNFSATHLDVSDTVSEATDSSAHTKSCGSLLHMKAQRENLMPIRKRSTDGALVPSELVRLGSDLVVGSSDDRPTRSTLPPLKRVSIPQILPDVDEHPDHWTSDSVQLRLKTRTHIQPINSSHQGAAAFVPSWKQELLEKRRKRESLSLPAEQPKDKSDLPPWKRELDERRKTIIGACPRVLEPIERDSEEIPDWAKSVETRRTRLANCGLIQTEEEEVIEEPRTN